MLSEAEGEKAGSFLLSFNKDLSHHRSTVLSRVIITSFRGGIALGGHKSALK